MRMLAPYVVVFLAACAQEVSWQKAGSTDQDLARDAEGCRARALSGTGAMGGESQRTAISYESCMEAKGWRRVQTPKP